MEITEMKVSSELLPEEVKQEVVAITTAIEALEVQLKEYVVLQKKYDDFRAQLYEAMTKYNLIKFTSEGGIQFTIVSGSDDKTEIKLEFDIDKFKHDEPVLYKQYLAQKEKITKGRAGYLRITIPKENDGKEVL
jgi:hypothetical protein